MHVKPAEVFRPTGVLNRFTQLQHSEVKYKHIFYKTSSSPSPSSVSWEAAKILRTSANWRNRRILEAWEINTCRNPLNRDDGMHLPHEFLNLALRDRT